MTISIVGAFKAHADLDLLRAIVEFDNQFHHCGDLQKLDRAALLECFEYLKDDEFAELVNAQAAHEKTRPRTLADTMADLSADMRAASEIMDSGNSLRHGARLDPLLQSILDQIAGFQWNGKKRFTITEEK